MSLRTDAHDFTYQIHSISADTLGTHPTHTHTDICQTGGNTEIKCGSILNVICEST